MCGVRVKGHLNERGTYPKRFLTFFTRRQPVLPYCNKGYRLDVAAALELRLPPAVSAKRLAPVVVLYRMICCRSDKVVSVYIHVWCSFRHVLYFPMMDRDRYSMHRSLVLLGACVLSYCREE